MLAPFATIWENTSDPHTKRKYVTKMANRPSPTPFLRTLCQSGDEPIPGWANGCFLLGEAVRLALTSPARDPLRLPGAAVAHGVEDEFDPAGNSQLIEDVKQIFLHRVLA
jgi:hypothetical protein